MPTSVRLPEEVERRLAALATKTGRTKAFYLRDAIVEHMDDLEDGYLAQARLEKLAYGNSHTVPLEEVMKIYDMGG